MVDSFATDLVHPWAGAFGVNFLALGQLAGKIPVTLLPAYASLMKMGIEIATDLKDGYNVTNDEGEEFLDAAKKFAARLPAPMQGNISSESDAGADAGGGLQSITDTYADTAYNAAQAVNNSPINPLGPNGPNVDQIIEDIAIIGALTIGALVLVPMLLRRI